ncbi:ABC transporter permease subunit [Phytohabitans sp. ZYX-F-186]|uniref:ABC transporter permease subunit n=1 Tax=Phytohabitans maris TaxID=3071409 RepID=A0ABU0ZYU2_9ACTN|nr:ABC transporter permease subunit [Phytohabitans sp. ZYX-F-186]MDQ7911122.1 ABC transporter permease subunit [Phytohabitans sp. ZYX-F-186]
MRPVLRRARGLVPLVALLALWQLFGTDDSVYFPRPSTWWTAMVAEWDNDRLVEAVAATSGRFVLSLAIATVIGALIGFAMAEVPVLDRSLNPTFEFLRVMPAAVTVPIFVLMLGYTNQMAVVAIVFSSMWPMILSTRSAAADIPPLLRDVGTTLHLSGLQVVRKILLPSLFPAVFLALRVAGPITFVVTLLVEMLTGITGTGSAIFLAQQSYQPSTVYGFICVVAIMALLVDVAAGRLEKAATAFGGARSRSGRTEQVPA